MCEGNEAVTGEFEVLGLDEFWQPQRVGSKGCPMARLDRTQLRRVDQPSTPTWSRKEDAALFERFADGARPECEWE